MRFILGNRYDRRMNELCGECFMRTRVVNKGVVVMFRNAMCSVKIFRNRVRYAFRHFSATVLEDIYS